MELRVLRYFLAVAREESISRAAAYLHVTQPTLSRQLMELEAELGKPLLIRGSRRVTLTEEGILFRRRASEIVELADRARSELQDGAVSGDLHIGGGESDAMRLLARTARILHETNPGIRYHLHSGNAEEVGEQLERGLLDFGVMVEPGNLGKYDHIRLPYTDTWGVLMRKDCPLAQKERIRPEDLWDLPLVLSRQAMGQDSVSTWLRRDYASLHIVGTYNLLFNASLLVDEGLGYALCLDKLANTGPESTLCFRHLEPKLEMGLYVVWKKYQVHSRAAETFLRLLRKQLEPD